MYREAERKFEQTFCESEKTNRIPTGFCNKQTERDVGFVVSRKVQTESCGAFVVKFPQKRIDRKRMFWYYLDAHRIYVCFLSKEEEI